MGEDEQDRILTVPAELDGSEPVLPTANEWVALPDMGPATGAVPCVTLLHEAAAGLLAFRGAPLSRPHCEVDGTPVAEDGWAHDLLAAHIPRHTATAGGCDLTLTTFCPPDHKGFVQVLEAVNSGPHAATVDLGLEGRFIDTDLHVFTPRAVSGPHRCAWDDWTRALVWEASAGLPIGALAVRALDGAPPGTEPDPPPVTGPELAWSHRHRATLQPGERTELVLCWGVGREADGAGLAAVHLARSGWRALLEATCRHLQARLGPPLPDRPGLEEVRNRNRLFSLGFAAGRTIDTERLVLVTSRSPRYYVSAAHWSRDSLLWAFPSVLAADLDLAADWLRAAFHLYTRNIGRHALYLDGGVLYDGFELDQVAAFHLALDTFLEAGGDARVLEEPDVRTGLRRVDAALEQARDPATGLLRTFLLSTDDPAPLPLVTYSNALSVAALRGAARTHERLGDGDAAGHRGAWADEVLAALHEHAVVDGPFGPMLCGATDGRGTHELFDEPPGSLELLAHYGVLADDDPLFTATVAWIHSEHNPYGPGPERYAAPSCAHAGHPWLLAVGNALLRGDERWLEALQELPLDNRLACESFDAESGQARTGVGFATCAGWIAHAIDVATARGPGAAS
jgi:uncharacterized protein